MNTVFVTSARPSFTSCPQLQLKHKGVDLQLLDRLKLVFLTYRLFILQFLAQRVFSVASYTSELIREETVVLLAVFTITLFNQMAMEVSGCVHSLVSWGVVLGGQDAAPPLSPPTLFHSLSRDWVYVAM